MADVGDVDDDRLSLIAPVGYSASTCGYCSPPGSGQRSATKSSKSYGIWSHFITPQAYEALVNRGWRRSGHYIYRPDNGIGRTCCPQVAIRLEVDEFKPKRQHKRAMRKLQRLVRTSVKGKKAHTGTASGSVERLPMPRDSYPDKGKYARVWDVEQEWTLVEARAHDDAGSDKELAVLSSEDCDEATRHAALVRYHAARGQAAQALRKGKDKNGHANIKPSLSRPCRSLVTVLRRGNYTDEKYAVFHKYQSQIHGEKDDKISRKGFERFLCKAPLMSTLPGSTSLQRDVQIGDAVDLDGADPVPYDLYHMEWRLDGQLIAIGVLDVLPRSLSSVYLFYDPAYKDWELGKVSVLREIALVKQLQRKQGMQQMRYYNMGLYIHKTPKMRYKAQFGPAQVLDPQTCQWKYLDDVREDIELGSRHDWTSGINTLPGQQKDDETSTLSGQDDRKDDVLVDASDSDEDSDGDEDEDMHMPRPPPPGILDPDSLSATDIARTCIFDKGQVSLLAVSV